MAPRLSLAAVSGGSSLVAMCGLLVAAASLVVEHKLKSVGSAVVARGLSCFVARGIFLDQGSNLCPLHWQVDSYPLDHQGSPEVLAPDGSCSLVTFCSLLSVYLFL